MKKKSVGRPLLIDEEVLRKLEFGFVRGYSDREACLHAGISTTTLYDYQERTPLYAERKAALKDSPKMLAKNVLNDAMQDGDKDISKFVLERRDPDFVKKSENKDKIIEVTLTREDMKDMSDEELAELM